MQKYIELDKPRAVSACEEQSHHWLILYMNISENKWMAFNFQPKTEPCLQTLLVTIS